MKTAKAQMVAIRRLSIRVARTVHSKSVNELAKTFPELEKARKFRLQGNFKSSLDETTRIHQIVENAMGKSSPMSFDLMCERVEMLRLLGNFSSALKLLHECNPDVSDEESLAHAIHRFQLQSLCNLQCGNSDRASSAADLAIQLCEKKNAAICHFAASYSLKGLSALFVGDITESETFLQLAARWSQDSYDESISIGNLGSLHLLQSDWNVNMSQKYTYQAWQQEFNEGFRVKIDRNENVNTAINYWDDAIKLFTDGRQTEVRSAGCSPSEEVLQVSTNDSTNGIPTNPAACEESTKNINNVQIVSCYASILCDSAELRAHLGEKEHASELLSSALKALDACAAADAHGIGTGNATAAAPVADVEQVVSRDSRQLALQPILGRVLGAMAQLHAEEAQAVTAEGLFRAALEKLTGPYAIHDPRHIYERAVVLGRYGALLQRWDKREESGAALIADARTVFSSALPVFPSKLKLSASIHYPL